MVGARTSGGPLTAEEWRAKIRTKEEKVRKLWQTHEDAAKATKAAKEAAEEAEAELHADVRDDPEGDLQFRDEAGP